MCRRAEPVGLRAPPLCLALFSHHAVACCCCCRRYRHFVWAEAAADSARSTFPPGSENSPEPGSFCFTWQSGPRGLAGRGSSRRPRLRPWLRLRKNPLPPRQPMYLAIEIIPPGGVRLAPTDLIIMPPQYLRVLSRRSLPNSVSPPYHKETVPAPVVLEVYLLNGLTLLLQDQELQEAEAAVRCPHFYCSAAAKLSQ